MRQNHTNQQTPPTKKASPYLLLPLLIPPLMLLLAFFPVEKEALHPHTTTATHNAQFIGSELYAHTKAEGKTTIHLKKYYTCGTTTHQQKQLIVLHETQLKRTYQHLNLQLENQTQTTEQSPPTCTDTPPNCITTLTYSATVDLPIMPNGYDVVWMQQQQPDQGNMPLPIEQQAGISLTIHLDDPMTAQPNHMPKTPNLPKHQYCTQTTHQIPFTAKDKEGDKLNYTLTPIHSFHPTKKEEHHTHTPAIETTPTALQANPLPQKILYTPPPFKPLTEVTMGAYEEINTKTKNTHLDANGVLHFTPQHSGKYLLGITLTEERNGQALSSHQSIFFIQAI